MRGGQNRVLLKTGHWPSSPQPKAHDGPATRWPSGPRPATAQRSTAHDGPMARSRFSTVFCPAVNPYACTGLHRVWACKMDDSKFEFVYHYNIKQSFRSFHLLHVATWKMFSFSVHSSVYKTQKRGSPFSTLQIIFKPQFEIENFILS